MHMVVVAIAVIVVAGALFDLSFPLIGAGIGAVALFAWAQAHGYGAAGYGEGLLALFVVVAPFAVLRIIASAIVKTFAPNKEGK